MPTNPISTGDIDVTPIVLTASDTMYPNDRNGTLARIDSLPPGKSVDNIFYFSIGGEYFRRVIDGPMSASYCGIYADGTDQKPNFNNAFAAGVRTIVFDNPQGGTYIIDSSGGDLNVPAGTVLKFYSGSMISGDGIINGGIIDAGYSQQIFGVSLTVNPDGVAGEWISVKWFGAKGNDSTSDNIAIQAAVDTVLRNNFKFTVLFFPYGSYKCDDSIACARLNPSSDLYEQVYITMKGEGEGYSTKFPSRGSQLRATFKDKPLVWWQIGKSGGMESLALLGAYAVPSLSASEFYNSDLTTYGDPSCSSLRYAPYCGIAIDAVRYTGAPIGGGYEGERFVYSSKNTPNSGSSGLSFKDVRISNFTVAAILSPNGQTQNDDCITFEDIKVDNCQVGFHSCQDQEKANVFKNIVSWGETHTLFANTLYGARTPGTVFISGVNIAVRNVQLFSWFVGGYHASFAENIYAESLGAIGSINTTGIIFSIKDSEIRFASVAERGGGLPAFHVDTTGAVVYDSVNFSNIGGPTFPVIIKPGAANPNPAFMKCHFDVIPAFFDESLRSSPLFDNCYLGNIGRIGVQGSVSLQIPQSCWYSAYGNFTIVDYIPYRYYPNCWPTYHFNSPRVWQQIATAGLISVTINNPTRVATFNTSLSGYHPLNSYIFLMNNVGAVFFGGMVTSVAGTTVTVSYVPEQLSSGSFTPFALIPIMAHGFLGDTSAGSDAITNAVFDIPVVVGSALHSSLFESLAVVTAVTGSTVTISRVATHTTQGTYFAPIGTKKVVTNPYSASDSTSISAGTLLQQGGEIVNMKATAHIKSIVTKSGRFNASAVGDTRQAMWSCVSLPTIIDRFYPGDPGKPAAGSITYQNDFLIGVLSTDFTVYFGGKILPYNSLTELSYTFNSVAGTIIITNGVFVAVEYVTIKGR